MLNDEIHRVIAGWYEQTIAGKQIHDQADSLPPHLPISLSPYVPLLAITTAWREDTERERRYMALLGEQAINTSAFRRRLRHFERAFAITPLSNPAQRSRLAAQLGRSYIFLGGQMAKPSGATRRAGRLRRQPAIDLVRLAHALS